MASAFTYNGQLTARTDGVTSLACPAKADSKITVVSAHRNKSVVVWKGEDAETRLEGHSDVVGNVTLTSDAAYAFSCSSDKTMHMWNLDSGESISKFDASDKILSCAVSPDMRMVVSVGADSKVHLWNTMGKHMGTIDKDCHTGAVNCVRFYPKAAAAKAITGGSDGTVKVWALMGNKCVATLTGHTGPVNAIAISPDGAICASAGKDGKVKVWDLSSSKLLWEMNAPTTVNDLIFVPNRMWLSGATDNGLCVWDLETKEMSVELVPEGSKKPICTSVAWAASGTTVYGGFSDNSVRQWEVKA